MIFDISLGIIFILISWYVHKHTVKLEYKYKYKEVGYAKFPLWLVLLACIGYFIPYIQITIFIIGFIIYIINLLDNEIRFKHPINGIFGKLFTYLNKQI